MVVVIVLLVLVPSLQPGIGWYNTGEFAAAAMTLDVPHAPGYPLFTRMANLMLKLPLATEPAWKVNLLAAICAALGAGLFASWLRAGGLSPILAGAAAVWMVSFTTFWEMATSAEVYTTEILLMSGFLLALWRARTEPPGLLGWLLIGLLFGLGIGHRPTFFPLAFGLTLVTLGIPRRSCEDTSRPLPPLAWGSMLTGLVVGFALGMLPTFDLFLRLQNPGLVLTDPLLGQGFDGFWKIFTAAAYRKGLGVFSVPELLARGRAWLEMMVGEGGLPILVLPCLAWLGRPSGWHPQVLALTWIFLINTGFVLNYNAFEAQTMLLPSILALTGLAAHGLHARHGRGRRMLGWSLAIVATVSLLVSAHRIEPRQRDAEGWAKRMAARIPRGATLLVSNDVEFRPLWYLRLSQGFRPDLAFRLIDRVEEKDLAEIERDVSRRGAFGTLVFPVDLRSWLSTRFCLEPLGYVYGIRQPFQKTFEANPGSWSRALSWGGKESIRAAVAQDILHVSDEQGPQAKYVPGEAHPGDVVSWEWAADGLGNGFQDLLAGVFLVDDSGRLCGGNGVILGFDLHSMADGMSPAVFRKTQETGNGAARRSLVIPPEIPKGRYALHFLVSRVSDPGWKNLIVERLEGMNLLNEDGATEVFKLKNGLGNFPLLRQSDWKSLVASLGGTSGAADWISLGTLEIR